LSLVPKVVQFLEGRGEGRQILAHSIVATNRQQGESGPCLKFQVERSGAQHRIVGHPDFPLECRAETPDDVGAGDRELGMG
jgi:hypothetical protein